MPLTIVPVESDCELPFDCGEDDIQRMMKESYYATSIKQSVAFNAIYDGKIVGQFMITSNWIKDEDYTWTYGYNTFGCLMIKYIAVSKDYQGRGVGSELMRYAIRYIKEHCKGIPIRFMVLESVQNKVEWYSSLGFARFSDNLELPNRDEYTVPMYLDFVNDIDKIDSEALTQC